jgi:cation:H+ antiporter
MKNEHDIAIGNVIGSNMFNLLGVLALPGVIHPDAVGEDVLNRDYPSMIAITALLYIMARGFRTRATLTRLKGGILIVAYLVYIGWLVLDAAEVGFGGVQF